MKLLAILLVLGVMMACAMHAVNAVDLPEVDCGKLMKPWIEDLDTQSIFGDKYKSLKQLSPAQKKMIVEHYASACPIWESLGDIDSCQDALNNCIWDTIDD